MKIGAIIQARMSSVRLPKKVLKSLPYGSNTTLIEQIIFRVNLAKSIDISILATSKNKENDELVQLLTNKKVPTEIFRGDEDDVLKRFYETAQLYQLDVIVRLTGDNPCIDPTIIDQAVRAHLDKGADYTITKGYPLGMNIEVISKNALEQAYLKASLAAEKEHVTPFIRNRPNIFKLFTLEEKNVINARLTIDTPQDYTLICTIFDFLSKDNPAFGIQEIKTLLQEKKYLQNINEQIIQKEFFATKAAEVESAIQLLEKQDMPRAANLLRHASN